MFIAKLVTSTILGGVLAGAVGVSAVDSRPRCVLGTYHVTAVEPLYSTKRLGRAETRQLAGAKVFVQAQIGLTPQWLQLNLNWHLDAIKGGGAADCPLGIPGVTAHVVPADTGFWVEIESNHTGSDAASEILARARALSH